jgi:hypothetical protein
MSAVAAELPTKRAEGFVVVDVVGFEEPPQPPVTLSTSPGKRKAESKP